MGGGGGGRVVFRWRTATHLRHQTTKSVRRILSNIGSGYWSPKAHKVIQGKCITLRSYSQRDPCKDTPPAPSNTAVWGLRCRHHLPKVPVVRLFSFLSNSLLVSEGPEVAPGLGVAVEGRAVRHWELWLRLWRPGGWAFAWCPVRWWESAEDMKPSVTQARGAELQGAGGGVRRRHVGSI